MRARRSLWLAPMALLASACATYTILSPEERGTLEREQADGQPAYLRLSMYVTPLFGDGGKKLLTPLPPDEVDLLEDPDGKIIPPGAVEKIIPAGTRVRVQEIEFPTSWVVASRILYTPKTQPWVYLAVDGEPKDVPYVLVLPPRMKTRAEVETALAVSLVREDPAPRLESYAPPVKEGIRAKRAVVDMPAEALEAAWGLPERKYITFDNSARLETWTYPGGKRKAFLRDGRLERFEGTNG